MRDGVQLTLGVCGEIRALGQVLAQQAISILVGSALPGAMRIGKEHLDREAVRQPLMLRHLFPPDHRSAFFAVGVGDMPKFLREALVRTCGICPIHTSQQDQAGRPFH